MNTMTNQRASKDAGAPGAPGAPGNAAIPGGSGGPKGWYSRGYLPHLDQPGLYQSITFRLHDSVPEQVIQRWKEELHWRETLPCDASAVVTLRQRIVTYEDAVTAPAGCVRRTSPRWWRTPCSTLTASVTV